MLRKNVTNMKDNTVLFIYSVIKLVIDQYSVLNNMIQSEYKFFCIKSNQIYIMIKKKLVCKQNKFQLYIKNSIQLLFRS